MRFVGLILFYWCVLAASGHAGAWLRDTGTGFLALSGTYRDTVPDPAFETSLYAEYGAAPRLTLGLDIIERSGTTGHALVFARLPIGSADGHNRLALELAVGGYHWQGKWSQMYKATLSYGRGFESRFGNGWLAVDAAIERSPSLPDTYYKLDTTIGLSSGGKIRPLMQIETSYAPGFPMNWAITPGIMIDAKQKPGKARKTWIVGIERKYAGQHSLGLKLGLWTSF